VRADNFQRFFRILGQVDEGRNVVTKRRRCRLSGLGEFGFVEVIQRLDEGTYGRL
jgi:hypothetical protein